MHFGRTTPFEDFVDDVNAWLDPRWLASEDEVLDIWSRGERNPVDAARQIELRRAHAPAHSALGFLGEIAAAIVLVPGGMFAVGFASLFPSEAQAATLYVGTRTEILIGWIIALFIGCVIGTAFGLFIAMERPRRPDPLDRHPAADHPDILELRGKVRR